MSAPREEAMASSIHDGLLYMGEIIERRPGQWEAATSDGAVIGVFPNPQAATDAILTRSRDA